MHVDRAFAGRALTAAALAGLVVAAGLLVWVGRTYFLLAFAGLLVALLLRGAADWLAEHIAFLSPRVALALVVVALLAATVGLIWLMAPNLVDQVDRLRQALPQALSRLETHLRDYAWGRTLVQEVTQSDLLSQQGSNLMGSLTGVFSTSLGVLGNLAVVLFLGLFVAAEPRVYREGLLRLLPHGARSGAADVLAQTGHTLRRWFVGRLLSMAVIGVGTGIGLALLGVPLALTLAVLATLLTFIPYIGPIASAVPAVLMALLQGPTLALWVVLLYAGLQFLESYVVTPLVQRRAVRIPPALLLSGQVLFGLLFGLLGIVLATPATVALMVIVRRGYVEGVLHDRPDAAEEA